MLYSKVAQPIPITLSDPWSMLLSLHSVNLGNALHICCENYFAKSELMGFFFKYWIIRFSVSRMLHISFLALAAQSLIKIREDGPITARRRVVFPTCSLTFTLT